MDGAPPVDVAVGLVGAAIAGPAMVIGEAIGTAARTGRALLSAGGEADAGAAAAEGVEGTSAAAEGGDWSFGNYKSSTKWSNQMNSRGWTSEQIDETIASGERFPAPNKVNPGNAATRYLNPTTGRYVVRDNVTKEILQISKDGFKPNLKE